MATKKKKRIRDEALLIMLTKTEKQAVMDASDARGMTMSAFARMVLLGEAKKEE